MFLEKGGGLYWEYRGTEKQKEYQKESYCYGQYSLY